MQLQGAPHQHGLLAANDLAVGWSVRKTDCSAAVVSLSGGCSVLLPLEFKVRGKGQKRGGKISKKQTRTMALG